MSNYGIFNPKPYDKVVKIFEKLKRKANESNITGFNKDKHDPRLGEHDQDQYFQQLRRDAMKSLHLLPEVQKTEEGFEVTGDKGLDPDYYSPDG